jgi:hypothetical protein
MMAVAGCGGGSEAGGTKTSDSDSNPDLKRYTVQGDVVELPVDGDERPRLRLAHDAMPDFVNRLGEVEGMKAMTMSFDLAPTLVLPEIEVGDQVQFVLEVDWNRDRPAQLVSVDRVVVEGSVEGDIEGDIEGDVEEE